MANVSFFDLDRHGHWVDLSYEYSAQTVPWPTNKPFELREWSMGPTDDGHYVAANTFTSPEHCGTHVDAPAHIQAGGRTVEEIALQNLVGPAAVIDVSESGVANRDYEVSTDDIRKWESAYGQIPENAIVLLNTGSGRFWPDPALFLGTNKRGQEGVAALHFPGLSPDAAALLVEHRNPRAVGIDTPSIDRGLSRKTPARFKAHKTLLGNDVPIFENVANLDQLPPVGSFVIALPMKIKGGSGAPLRIAARVPLATDHE